MQTADFLPPKKGGIFISLFEVLGIEDNRQVCVGREDTLLFGHSHLVSRTKGRALTCRVETAATLSDSCQMKAFTCQTEASPPEPCSFEEDGKKVK
jgi:hypothetical protein